MNYEVKDIKLAPGGHRKIQWVKNNMPVLSQLEKEFEKAKPFENVKISLSIHMEAKTAYLCKVLVAGGAVLSATGSNVLSTQDDVAAALADSGISVFAVHGASAREYMKHIGIIRLKAMEKYKVLNFPMIAVNDADCKHLFDNRYGTGQSVWDSIMRNTNLVVAGKTVVVAGYGWCSRGIAMRAAGLGAKVIVTEIDPIKAMEAKMDGFEVMTMMKAAVRGDFFVTATGCRDTITNEHISNMKSGAILANAGHFNVEIDMEALEKTATSKREQRKNITGYEMNNGKWINVIGEGRLVNIAAADGHPAEIMDLSFAVQALSALYIKENKDNLKRGKVIQVPREIDQTIAEKRLEAWGIEIDKLTDRQREYLDSWNM